MYLKKIPIVFHNGYNCNCYFTIKEFAQNQFTCLEENTEKYITFAVSIEKEAARIDKNRKVITKIKRLQFIDSARFMVSPLSFLVNTLSDGIHKIKCTN